MARYGSILKTTVQMFILNASSIREYTANFNGFSPFFYVNGQLLPVVHVHMKIYNASFMYICTPGEYRHCFTLNAAFQKIKTPEKINE